VLNWLLEVDPTKRIADVNLFFRGELIVALVLAALAVALVLYLYRSENRVSPTRRTVMSVCQGLALLVLIIIVAKPAADIQIVEPYQRSMLVLLDTSRSMSIADQRTTPAEVSEAAKVLGKVKMDAIVDTNNVDSVRKDIGQPTRIDLARAAMTSSDINLLRKLDEQFDVQLFTFDEGLNSESIKELDGWLNTKQADGDSSRIGSALEDAVGRYAGQSVAGVVIISDFATVKGENPVAIARELQQRGIPVHAIPVGLPAPPDVILQRLIAPEVVFKGDHVPIRLQLESHGFKGSNVEVSLTIDGERTASKQVELKGGVQFEELMFTPQQESGTLTLNVEVAPIADETTRKNNKLTHKVRILDEKIKVLYIEGMPRWEYRYLRWVLLRDPRLEVQFLMTQGDPALAKSSPRHLAQFPQDAKDAMKYDLIILGDVPASFFKGNQMQLIDDLVKTSGGSLLMVAGPMAAPASYRNTRIADMLPVKIGTGQWMSLGADVHPVVTEQGRDSAVTSLSLSPETNERIWSHVRPMNAVPQLDGAKSAATVLLSLPKAAEQIQDYPLVAWQRYGNGKSMFVATEDLWRMRLEVGDRYHARFWGQSIQFLTLSRLLGQNKQISLETERSSYSAGQRVTVYANVLTQAFEPVEQPSYPVIVERKDTPDTAAELELTPVPGSPGLYSGVLLADQDGSYSIRTRPPDAEISNRAEFQVVTVPMEDRETAMQADIVKQIAEITGGKSMALVDLAKFPEQLEPEGELLSEVRSEKDLWDAPLLFLLLVMFAGTEWYLRRRDNLV